MDPATIQKLLQGGAMSPGTSTPPSPEQMLTIQNLMKNPGGMGAMQQNNAMQGMAMPQDPNMGLGGQMGNQASPQPPVSPQLQQQAAQAQQLLQQYNQPQPQPNIPVGP